MITHTTVKARRKLIAATIGSLALASLLVGATPAGAIVPGPNGLIAFESNRDGNNEIYVMNPDGTVEENLTNNPANDVFPAWSPGRHTDHLQQRPPSDRATSTSMS